MTTGKKQINTTIDSTVFDNFKKACDDYNLKMNTVLELLLEDFSTGDYDIIINLDYINNSYRIEIANTIKESVLSGNKTLKTSKSDTKNHGIGIKSVKSRAEKYNGKTEFTEENGQFVARVWLMA